MHFGKKSQMVLFLGMMSFVLLQACGKKEGSEVLPVCAQWTDASYGNKIDYCIKTIDIGREGRTLYAFHGMGGNAEGFCNKVTAAPESFSKGTGISHIVCPSFG